MKNILSIIGKNKKIVIAIAVAVVLTIAAITVMQVADSRYKASPEYALEQLKTAVKSRNKALFQYYVDVDKLAEHIVDQAFKTGTAKNSDDDIFSQIGSSLGRKLASFVRPEMTSSLRRQILDAVETGTFAKTKIIEINPASKILRELLTDLTGSDYTFKGLGGITEDGTHATTTLTFYRNDLDTDITLIITMNMAEKRWKVIDIPNLSQILEKVEGLRTAHIRKLNTKASAYMNQSIAVRNAIKSQGVSEYGIGRTVLLRIGFENIGKKDILSFRARVNFHTTSGDILRSVTISDKDILNVGTLVEKSWPMSINPLSKTDEIIFTATEGTLKIEVILEKITFVDGEVVELV